MVALCAALMFAATAPAQDLVAATPATATASSKADAAKARLRWELLELEIALRPFVRNPEAKERLQGLMHCVAERSTASLVIGGSPLAGHRPLVLARQARA